MAIFTKKSIFAMFLTLNGLAPFSFAHADSINSIPEPIYGFNGTPYMNQAGTLLAGNYFVDSNSDYAGYRWTAANGFQALSALSISDRADVSGGIDADGLVIVGRSTYATYYTHAVKWIGNNATIEDLGILAGGTQSEADAVSADGNIVVGTGDNGTYGNVAIRWVGNNPGEALGVLSGDVESIGTNISADGSTILGISLDASSNQRAVRWVGNNPIEALATLPGIVTSQSTFSDADGSVILGTGYDASNAQYGLRWTGNNTVTVLSTLPGYDYSGASAITADGSVIVGAAVMANFSSVQAARWDGSNATIQALGWLPGGSISEAIAISADKHVIVGASTDGSGIPQAVRWVDNNPIESVASVLTAHDVDLTGWSLQVAEAVSTNGNIISGQGNDNGSQTIFIANVTTGGLTTPQNLATSLQGNVAASQQVSQVSVSNLSQSLFAAQNLGALSVSSVTAPQVRQPSVSTVVKHPDGSQTISMTDDDASYGLLTPYQPTLASRLSVFTVGSLGLGEDNNFDNHEVNGIVGASVRMDHDVTVGLGYLGATSHNDMIFGGKDDVDARGVSALFSYLPQYGLRAFGTAYMADMDLTIDRNYQNGAGISGSRGKTNGNAHGVAAEVGYAYAINPILKGVPFVNTRWSRTSVDAYSETGGPFDADFSTQKNTNVTSELGYELDYQMNNKTSVYGRAGLDHRFSGNGGDFTASAVGVTEALGTDPGDRNWITGAIGTNYQATDKIRLSAELSGRTADTQEPETTLTVGANISF